MSFDRPIRTMRAEDRATKGGGNDCFYRMAKAVVNAVPRAGAYGLAHF